MVKAKIIIICLVVCINGLYLTACGNNAKSISKKVINIENVSTSVSTKDDTENKENKFVQDLIKYIKNKDVISFRKLIPQEGSLLVVRSFSSGNGTRGSEVIMNEKPNQISDDITFSVSGETPIDMSFLLSNLIKDGISQIDVERIEKEHIKSTEFKSTEDVWNKCSEILEKMTNKDWVPHLLLLDGKQIAIYEGGDEDGFPCGGWVICDDKNGSYEITGIYDLR